MNTPTSPIADFSQCHAGILAQLLPLAELPALLDAAARARTLADSALAFFDHAVRAHHADEERDLFPAVLQHAQPGTERAEVQALVDQLVAEHRRVEALWKQLEPGLRHAARGQAAELDPVALATLVADYRAHAAFEESDFLPLAQRILGRHDADLAALGLRMHTRHAMDELVQQIGFHV